MLARHVFLLAGRQCDVAWVTVNSYANVAKVWQPAVRAVLNVTGWVPPRAGCSSDEVVDSLGTPSLLPVRGRAASHRARAGHAVASGRGPFRDALSAAEPGKAWWSWTRHRGASVDHSCPRACPTRSTASHRPGELAAEWLFHRRRCGLRRWSLCSPRTLSAAPASPPRRSRSHVEFSHNHLPRQHHISLARAWDACVPAVPYMARAGREGRRFPHPSGLDRQTGGCLRVGWAEPARHRGVKPIARTTTASTSSTAVTGRASLRYRSWPARLRRQPVSSRSAPASPAAPRSVVLWPLNRVQEVTALPASDQPLVVPKSPRRPWRTSGPCGDPRPGIRPAGALRPVGPVSASGSNGV